jgi:hypothetical protein
VEACSYWQPALEQAGGARDWSTEICPAQSLEGKRCSIMEMDTLLTEGAQILNSHPLAEGKPMAGPANPPPPAAVKSLN